METINPLADWLNQQLQERGWSLRYAAERGGVSPTAFSNIQVGTPVRLVTYKALARAFNVSLIFILEKAGEIAESPATANMQEAIYHFRQLDEDQQQTVLGMLRGLTDKLRDQVQGDNPCQRPANCPMNVPVMTRAEIHDAISDIEAEDGIEGLRLLTVLFEALEEYRQGERKRERKRMNA
jgi:transcriptional regulator with XRE-family HTH domain